jgi:hypothetical protein
MTTYILGRYKKENSGAGDVAQVTDYLPTKHEALSSSSNTDKERSGEKRRRKERKEEKEGILERFSHS